MDKKCLGCRKFGDKLFLKGDRCLSPKCAVTRRVAPSGTVVLRKKRVKKSEYGLQLSEKQKAKTEYGLRERQFRLVFEKAAKSKGATGETLLKILETRLDNVVYRAGWARSRAQARQIVNHGHIMVNGKIVDIPSFQVKVKDVIEPAKIDLIKNLAMEKANPPKWLKVKGYKMEVVELPTREEIDTPINEQLIVEFYSR